MAVYQAYNHYIRKWVKFRLLKKGSNVKWRIIQPKKENPKVPFKGIPIKGQTLESYREKRKKLTHELCGKK
jgi:hypothetical protein